MPGKCEGSPAELHDMFRWQGRGATRVGATSVIPLAASPTLRPPGLSRLSPAYARMCLDRRCDIVTSKPVIL